MQAWIRNDAAGAYRVWRTFGSDVFPDGHLVNGIPIRILRALEQFQDVCDCDGILGAFFTVDANDTIQYFEIEAQFPMGVASFTYDRDSRANIHFSDELKKSLGAAVTRRLERLYNKWFTLGFLPP